MSEIEELNYYNSGIENIWNNHPKKALNDLNKVIELNPIIANAYSYRGWCKHLLNDTKGAFEDFNKSYQLNPNNPFNMYFVGIIYMDADLEKAKDFFDQVIELEPNFNIEKGGNAYIMRGKVKTYQEDLKGAIEDFNKGIEINPNIAEFYADRGLVKEGLNDLQGSIDDFTKAIEMDPNLANKCPDIFPDIYINRGISKGILKDLKGAIDDFSKAIEIDPNIAPVYSHRGMAKAMSKDIQGAIDDFSKAIEIDPNDSDSQKNRSEAVCILKEQYEQNKSFQVKTCPELYITLKDAYSYSNRGLGKLMSFEYIGAMDDFSKAIEIDSNYASAYYLRGSAKYGLCDYQGALDDCNKAIDINPKHYLSYQKRGESKQKLGDKIGSNEDIKIGKEIESKHKNAFDKKEITFDYTKVVATYKKD